MNIQELYHHLPTPIQNLGISIRNYFAFNKRYGKHYEATLEILESNKDISLEELKRIQQKKLENFINFSYQNSSFYQKFWKSPACKNLNDLPILQKQLFKENVGDIKTIRDNNGVITKTGGTTGKSLQIVITKEDMQERYAFLDHFRTQHGYQLGKKTAWFSGKEILSNRDVKKNIFWKTDVFHKIRYYSTFHINDYTAGYYIENIIKYNPQFFSGFPTSINQLAVYGLEKKLSYPKGTLKAIFTTSETVTPIMRLNIETFFQCKLYDQYSASEGAPFIFECKEGNLHLELQSGVFEVLDEDNNSTNCGRMVITSFTSHGTPLVRYDIGDHIELSEEKCACGNNNPLCKQILGRLDDFVYSKERGKINLVNSANAFKDVKGIVNAQVIQSSLDEITLKIVAANDALNKKEELRLINNWEVRVGKQMKIHVTYVSKIDKEKSGKYRLIKNSIKFKN